MVLRERGSTRDGSGFSGIFSSCMNKDNEETKMNTNTKWSGSIPAIAAGFCLLSLETDAANILVGSGPDTSYFVVESPNIGVRTYEINYTYDATADQDGFFLLDALLTADTDLSADLSNFGTASEPNFIVNSFTFDSVTETSASSSPFVPFWAHWVAGGDAGFPTANPVADGTWTSGSGISSPFRLIEPGSSDALFFSDGSTQPSVAPIPEPSVICMLASGALLVLRRRRTA